jgi:hypothetical protein
VLNPLRDKNEPLLKGHHHYHYHHLCQQYMGQNVSVELDDGNMYHGRLHSYDNNNMYLVMPGESERDSRILFVGPFFPGFGLFGCPFFRIRRFRPYW